ADGDGFFDVRVDLSTSIPFGAGDKITFEVQNTTVANAFDVSVNGPVGKNGFYAAVHAQSLSVPGTTADSGWYTGTPHDIPNPPGSVPAPPAIILLATALPVLGLRRYLRRKAD
ncbi:MAG TPA: hypothetical protein VLM40_12560, partial [Gemmata sp.]|nr:hypothetical protein [Gemmata sp.]